MPLRRLRLAWRMLVRFVMLATNRFIDDRCLVGASALSYTSIVSLVPLTAVVLVTFSGFPVFSTVRERLLGVILENFAPDIGDEAATWFAFAANNAARTTAVGILSLVVTAILLLATIEDQMHLIFRVTRPRSWGQRVLVYWTVLTMGPLLLGIGMSISGQLDAVFTSKEPLGLAAAETARAWAASGLNLLPLFFETAALAMLYYLMPQRTVRWIDSFIGAVTACLLLQVLRFGFSVFVSQLASYSRVYGALAGIPIFLLWMYIFWIAVLIGAEITATLARHHKRTP
ncbi:MAG TPA: YihY family inner membrane protein [Acetobacteraceae bacterium]|jgi:membrane protein